MKKLINALFICVLSMPGYAEVAIEVFTDGPLDISNYPSIKHYDLTEPQQVRQRMAPRLPANPEEATRLATIWFQSPAGLAYQQAMAKAYIGQKLVMQYKLEKIPAIVFSRGEKVVYGITDIERAISIYNESLSEGAAQ